MLQLDVRHISSHTVKHTTRARWHYLKRRLHNEFISSINLNSKFMPYERFTSLKSVSVLMRDLSPPQSFVMHSVNTALDCRLTQSNSRRVKRKTCCFHSNRGNSWQLDPYQPSVSEKEGRQNVFNKKKACTYWKCVCLSCVTTPPAIDVR